MCELHGVGVRRSNFRTPKQEIKIIFNRRSKLFFTFDLQLNVNFQLLIFWKSKNIDLLKFDPTYDHFLSVRIKMCDHLQKQAAPKTSILDKFGICTCFLNALTPNLEIVSNIWLPCQHYCSTVKAFKAWLGTTLNTWYYMYTFLIWFFKI